MTLKHGIRDNLGQFLHQLLQVMLVGLTIGMMRTVVPALAESEFGVPKTSFLLLTSFVIAFGVVKAIMNFVAGRLSEHIGRKRVLMLGWILAIPVPIMIWYAPNWNWVVAATVLLGINQGLTWSMTQTAKLDITRMQERGITLGLNEFAGYMGVALAGMITAWLAIWLGPRLGLLLFGLIVIASALILTKIWVRETMPWVKLEAFRQNTGSLSGSPHPRYPSNVSSEPTTFEIFALMSGRDRRLFALSQAGLVEKFVDALIWVFYPVYLYEQGINLTEVGSIIGIYGVTWGVMQLFTGRLSDRIGRQWPNVTGMLLSATGVMMMINVNNVTGWSLASALTGLGMALLYPNLSAAVADISHPLWRGSAIGIYRFWRDLGYALGALGIGLVAHFTGQLVPAFWFVALSMLGSTVILWWMGEETHPGKNPAESVTTPSAP